MDKIEGYLNTNTSIRDYISFDEFKKGFGINERLLRQVYQQLISKDQERHEQVEENLKQHEELLNQHLHQIAEPIDSDSKIDMDQLNELAKKLSQKLDERVIELDLDTDKLARQSDKLTDSLNDLRYTAGNESSSIKSTRQEINALLDSLSSLQN